MQTETKLEAVRTMCIRRLIMQNCWQAVWEADLRFPAEFVVMENISALRESPTSIQDPLQLRITATISNHNRFYFRLSRTVLFCFGKGQFFKIKALSLL